MSDNDNEGSDSVVSDSVSDSGPAQLNNNRKKESKKASHPPYLTMLVEAIREQKSRNGVSRAKIVQYMKSKYKLDDVSAPALRKAAQTAEMKEMIERKTGVGMNGSYVLSKKEKLESRKMARKAANAQSGSEKEEKAKPEKAKPEKAKPEKAKPEKAKPEKVKPEKVKPGKSKPKDKILKDKVTAKKGAKKAPVAKGKENKATWKKGDPVRKPKILEAKVALTKAKISKDLMNADTEKPVPSTSKQRASTKKKPPPKEE